MIEDCRAVPYDQASRLQASMTLVLEGGRADPVTSRLRVALPFAENTHLTCQRYANERAPRHDFRLRFPLGQLRIRRAPPVSYG